MKKKDQNMLMLGAAGVAGYFAYKHFTKPKGPVTSGFPGQLDAADGYGGPSYGIGAMMPSHSIVPESMRGKCSPVMLDAALWGSAGAAVGYFLLAGKKLKL